MLEWNEKFETGNAVVDAQHRMLVSYVNQLGELARNTNPSRAEVELFARFMVFLETYILTHFRDEEECMLRFRCPAHAENKLAHQTFLEFFKKFKLRLETGGYRPEAMRELHESCCSWIQRHILRTDVRLKPCLRQILTPETTELPHPVIFASPAPPLRPSAP